METKQTHLCDLLRECLEHAGGHAWDQLIRGLQPSVAAAVARVLGRVPGINGASVDDVVQTTFVRLLEDQARRLRTFQGEHDAQLFAYVRAVATHLAIDAIRRNRREVEFDEEQPAPAFSSDQRVLMQEVERFLDHCSRTNLERDRLVFWAHFKEGMSAAAIAAIPDVGLTTKGVESLLFRLVRCIRQQIFNSLAKGNPEPERRSGRV